MGCPSFLVTFRHWSKTWIMSKFTFSFVDILLHTHRVTWRICSLQMLRKIKKPNFALTWLVMILLVLLIIKFAALCSVFVFSSNFLVKIFGEHEIQLFCLNMNFETRSIFIISKTRRSIWRDFYVKQDRSTKLFLRYHNELRSSGVEIGEQRRFVKDSSTVFPVIFLVSLNFCLNFNLH